MPWVGLQYVIMVFPDHTHLLFNDDPSLKLSSVGWCLLFVFGWAHSDSTRDFLYWLFLRKEPFLCFITVTVYIILI